MSADILTRIREADLAAAPTAPTLTNAEIRTRVDSIVDGAADRTAPQTVTPTVTPLHRRASRRTRTRTLVAVSASAAVALGLVVTSITVDDGAGGGPKITVGGSSAEAAELLEQAARITPADPPVAPGQYWQVRSVSVQEGGSSLDNPARMGRLETERTDWIPVDADGSVFTVRDTRFLGSADVTDTSHHVWEFPALEGHQPWWSGPTPEFLAALPRDTDALRERLYADAAGRGQSLDGEVFVLIGDVLRSGVVPADLRAALFHVMQTVPGVEVTDHSAVLDGRTGVAFGRVEPGANERYEIVIDPETGTVIGEREVVANAEPHGIGARARHETGHVLYQVSVTRELVDAVPGDVLDKAVPQVAG